MRYLGGKSRIAREVAAVVAPTGWVWEPFMGGGAVTVALAELAPRGAVLASDLNEALPCMYQALVNGWDPPEVVTRDEHRAARSLPDTDPRKAFIGVGCSFGGDWFQGYSEGKKGDGADTTRRVLLNQRDVWRARMTRFARGSFFDVEPVVGVTVYADPPYRGTASYAATPLLDHDAFWARCRDWVRVGSRVFVSEYACPVPHEVVWSRSLNRQINQSVRLVGDATPVEKLFRVR